MIGFKSLASSSLQLGDNLLVRKRAKLLIDASDTRTDYQIIEDYLLTQTIIVSEIEIPYYSFIILHLDELGDIAYNDTRNKTYRYLWGQGKGTFTNTNLGYFRFVNALSSSLEDIEDEDTITYDLGTLALGIDFIEDVINNAVTPYDFSNSLKTYFVTFIQEDVPYLYHFVGTNAFYGDGQAQAVPTDFVLLNIGITPSGQGLQEVVDINKTADKINLTATRFKGLDFVAGESSLLYVLSLTKSINDGMFVYGNFASYGGVASKDIIKILPNGEVDTSFNIGVGLAGSVGYPYTGSTLYEDNLGNIFITGSYTSINGVSANRIVKLLPNGTIDTAFNTNTGVGFGTSTSHYTLAIYFDSTGSFYLSGAFTSYKGVSGQGNIIKLLPDGNVDTSFIKGTGFNNSTVSVIVNSDDTLFVTTYGTTYKGVACKNLVKLLPNGSVDASFVIATGFNTAVSHPNNIIHTPDGKYLLSGAFTSFNGISRNNIMKMNHDGTEDTSFVSGTGFGFPTVTVKTAFPRLIFNGTKYLIRGNFDSYNGVSSWGNIILNLDGSIYQTFTSPYNSISEVDGVVYGLDSTLGKLVKYVQDTPYTEISPAFTFDENEARAKYSIDHLSETTDNEVLPKKLIEELIESYLRSLEVDEITILDTPEVETILQKVLVRASDEKVKELDLKAYLKANTATYISSGENGFPVINTITIAPTYSRLIKAGTVNSNSVVSLLFRWTSPGAKTSITNGYIHINSVESLSGATQLAICASGPTNRTLQLRRELSVKGTNTKVINPATSVVTDDAGSAAMSLIAINWNIDQYIIFSIGHTTADQNSNGDCYNITIN